MAIKSLAQKNAEREKARGKLSSWLGGIAGGIAGAAGGGATANPEAQALQQTTINPEYSGYQGKLDIARLDPETSYMMDTSGYTPATPVPAFLNKDGAVYNPGGFARFFGAKPRDPAAYLNNKLMLQDLELGQQDKYLRGMAQLQHGNQKDLEGFRNPLYIARDAAQIANQAAADTQRARDLAPLNVDTFNAQQKGVGLGNIQSLYPQAEEAAKQKYMADTLAARALAQTTQQGMDTSAATFPSRNAADIASADAAKSLALGKQRVYGNPWYSDQVAVNSLMPMVPLGDDRVLFGTNGKPSLIMSPGRTEKGVDASGFPIEKYYPPNVGQKPISVESAAATSGPSMKDTVGMTFDGMPRAPIPAVTATVAPNPAPTPGIKPPVYSSRLDMLQDKAVGTVAPVVKGVTTALNPTSAITDAYKNILGNLRGASDVAKQYLLQPPGTSVDQAAEAAVADDIRNMWSSPILKAPEVKRPVQEFQDNYPVIPMDFPKKKVQEFQDNYPVIPLKPIPREADITKPDWSAAFKIPKREAVTVEPTPTPTPTPTPATKPSVNDLRVFAHQVLMNSSEFARATYGPIIDKMILDGNIEGAQNFLRKLVEARTR